LRHAKTNKQGWLKTNRKRFSLYRKNLEDALYYDYVLEGVPSLDDAF
jgi:hypothetical protein